MVYTDSGNQYLGGIGNLMRKCQLSLMYIAIVVSLFFSIMTFSVSAQENGPRLLFSTHLGDGSWQTVWSPDSTKVVAYRRIDAALQVYDIQEERSIYEFTNENDIQDVAWLPDSSQVLIGTTEGVVKVIDIQTGFTLAELFHPDAIYHIRVSENGEHALISGAFGTARVWNVSSGSVEFELDPAETIIRAEWEENLQRIRTFSSDGFMSIWDLETDDHLLTIQHDDWIYGSTWNADGSQIITYGQDHTARISDTETGEIVLELAHDDVVYDAAWIADGTRVMTCSGDGFIHIWTLDGTEIRTLAYRGFEFLDDGATVLSRNRDTIQIWNWSNGEEVRAFVHESFISGDEISPNGTQLLTWTMSGIGRIWDIETGDEVWRFETPLRQAHWSPNGDMILTITEERVLEVWRMS